MSWSSSVSAVLVTLLLVVTPALGQRAAQPDTPIARVRTAFESGRDPLTRARSVQAIVAGFEHSRFDETEPQLLAEGMEKTRQTRFPPYMVRTYSLTSSRSKRETLEIKLYSPLNPTWRDRTNEVVHARSRLLTNYGARLSAVAAEPDASAVLKQVAQRRTARSFPILTEVEIEYLDPAEYPRRRAPFRVTVHLADHTGAQAKAYMDLVYSVTGPDAGDQGVDWESERTWRAPTDR